MRGLGQLRSCFLPNLWASYERSWRFAQYVLERVSIRKKKRRQIRSSYRWFGRCMARCFLVLSRNSVSSFSRLVGLLFDRPRSHIDSLGAREMGAVLIQVSSNRILGGRTILVGDWSCRSCLCSFLRSWIADCHWNSDNSFRGVLDSQKGTPSKRAASYAGIKRSSPSPF